MYQLTLLVFIVGCTMVTVFTGFVMKNVAPVIGILAIYTIVMIIVSVVKSYRGDYVEIPLSAEFIK